MVGANNHLVVVKLLLDQEQNFSDASYDAALKESLHKRHFQVATVLREKIGLDQKTTGMCNHH